jgi:hypothetical protein
MRSRADLVRWTERALRVTAYLALALGLYLAIRARSIVPRQAVVTPAMLPFYLAESAASLDSIAVVGDTALEPVYRDWLAAERMSGRPVSWSGSLAPVAIEIDPIADPAGGDRILVAAPQGMVQLRDSLGVLDSAIASGGGAGFEASVVRGSVEVTVTGQRARAVSRDSIATRRITVLGRPSWETKFVIAALEERGWLVDARIPLTPDTAVIQGAPSRLDTARVAVVVALDDAAGREAGRIRRFVEQGGGLVLGAEAARLPGFGGLRAGAVGTRVPAIGLEPPADNPKRGLALVPVARLDPNGIVLEKRGGSVALAARRVGLGRVIQLGYEDTWRWRMAGAPGSVEAHRRWWAGLVGSVAYRATIPGVAPVSPHDAPLARTVARLGPADSSRDATPSPRPDRSSLAGLLFGLAVASLLGEWASRRWRGAV